MKIVDHPLKATIYDHPATASAAAKRWAKKLGAPVEFSGCGNLGNGRYVAWVDGKGWLAK